MPQPHSAHDFRRVVARSLDPIDGRVIYGCAFSRSDFAGCAETEIRREGQPSPHAVKREAARRSSASKHRGA